MKLTYLSLAVATVCVGTMSASAGWLDNIRDDLTFSVSARVSPSLQKTDNRFTYVHANPSVYGRTGTLTQVLADQDRRDSDDVARLGGVNSVGVSVSASQNINRNWSVYAVLAVGAHAQGSSFAGYGLRVLHKKYGYIYLNNGGAFGSSATMPAITTTQAELPYRLLDTNAGSQVSATFDKIPNWTVSGYYAFPGVNDTRLVSDVGIHSAHGFAVNYAISPKADHSLSIGAGYAKSKRHPELKSESVAKHKEAAMLGLNYGYKDWTFSLSGGQSRERLDGARLAKVTNNALAAQVKYDITPRLSATVRYMQMESDKDATSGNPITYDDFISAGRGVGETLYFDSVKRQRAYVGLDYQLYSNVSLSATASQDRIENHLADAFFSKRENTQYTLGASFGF